MGSRCHELLSGHRPLFFTFLFFTFLHFTFLPYPTFLIFYFLDVTSCSPGIAPSLNPPNQQETFLHQLFKPMHYSTISFTSYLLYQNRTPYFRNTLGFRKDSL